MKRFTLIVCLCLALSLTPLTALSQGYIGGFLGQSDIGSDFDKSTSYSLLGGYRFNDYIALEASYVNLGEADYKYYSPTIYVDADGWNASVLGILPITEKFELFGNVGFMAWEAGGGSGDISVDVVDGEDFNFGAGLAYNFTDKFSLYGGYQQYRFEAFGESDNVKTYYLGTKIYFGNRSQESKQKTSAPVQASYQTQPTSTPNYQLRAVSESAKQSCEFIRTITRGSGGPGDQSIYTESAMENALIEAAKAGANSYYIVDMETTANGASVVLEALNCN